MHKTNTTGHASAQQYGSAPKNSSQDFEFLHVRTSLLSMTLLAQLGQTLLAVTQSAARNQFQPFQDRQQSVVRHKQANEGLVLYVST